MLIILFPFPESFFRGIFLMAEFQSSIILTVTELHWALLRKAERLNHFIEEMQVMSME